MNINEVEIEYIYIAYNVSIIYIFSSIFLAYIYHITNIRFLRIKIKNRDPTNPVSSYCDNQPTCLTGGSGQTPWSAGYKEVPCS